MKAKLNRATRKAIKEQQERQKRHAARVKATEQELAAAVERVKLQKELERAANKWEITGNADTDALTLIDMSRAAYWTKLKWRANNDNIAEVEQLQPADREEVESMGLLAMYELYAEGETNTKTLYRAALKGMNKFWDERRKPTTEYNPNFKRVNPEPRTATPTPTSKRADRAVAQAVELAELDRRAAAVAEGIASGNSPRDIRENNGLTVSQYRKARENVKAAILDNINPADIAEVVTPSDYAATVAEHAAKRNARKAADRKRNATPERKAAKAAAARARRAAAKAAQG